MPDASVAPAVAIATLAGLAGAGALAARGRRARLVGQARAFLARFERVPALGAYRPGLARVAMPGPKKPHAVLLVHGFSASPAAFDRLVPLLEAGGVPYYAPALTGFGLDDFRLLEASRGEDWRRDVFAAYDVLAAIADEISVVAISFGTLVAAELARERPVRHLVLVAPYFHLLKDGDKRMREAFRSPWRRALALALSPWVAKPVRPGRTTPVDMCDDEAARGFFQFPALPLASLMAVWAYPREVDWRALKHQTLDVLWGEQEGTSDVPALLAELEAAGVAVRARSFPRSAHNLLSDHDGTAASAAIAAILAEGPPPPPLRGTSPPRG